MKRVFKSMLQPISIERKKNIGFHPASSSPNHFAAASSSPNRVAAASSSPNHLTASIHLLLPPDISSHALSFILKISVPTLPLSFSPPSLFHSLSHSPLPSSYKKIARFPFLQTLAYLSFPPSNQTLFNHHLKTSAASIFNHRLNWRSRVIVVERPWVSTIVSTTDLLTCSEAPSSNSTSSVTSTRSHQLFWNKLDSMISSSVGC